ncbi:hypothetical protein F2P79_001765 [Pimephales promelas]|nr:hypothetical protein F2P79_001765 [Pimephales promelas]
MLVHFRLWRLKRRKTEKTGRDYGRVFKIYCPPVFEMKPGSRGFKRHQRQRHKPRYALHRNHHGLLESTHASKPRYGRTHHYLKTQLLHSDVPMSIAIAEVPFSRRVNGTSVISLR